MEGKLYRLQGDDGSFYIGSCFISLVKRLSIHKYDCIRRPTTKIYKHFTTIGWDRVDMVLLKEITCDNKEDLRVLEQEEINKHKGNPQCLNSFNAFGVDKEKIISKNKRLYEENKEAITRRHTAYNKEHRDEANKRSRESRHKKLALQKIASQVIEDAVSQGPPR